MKPVYVIVEGKSEAALLQRILPPELTREAQFVTADLSATIPSLARSYLVRRRKPVVVVLDSESLDPTLIEERRESTDELIRSVAGSIPVKVVVAVPEVEGWFFAAPEVIERVLGEKVPNELVPLGQRDPRGVLNQLENKSTRKWDPDQAIKELDAQDVERIRAIPAVSELSAFLSEMQNDGRAA